MRISAEDHDSVHSKRILRGCDESSGEKQFDLVWQRLDDRIGRLP
jgi:hypothetical protein